MPYSIKKLAIKQSDHQATQCPMPYAATPPTTTPGYKPSVCQFASSRSQKHRRDSRPPVRLGPGRVGRSGPPLPPRRPRSPIPPAPHPASTELPGASDADAICRPTRPSSASGPSAGGSRGATRSAGPPTARVRRFTGLG